MGLLDYISTAISFSCSHTLTYNTDTDTATNTGTGTDKDKDKDTDTTDTQQTFTPMVIKGSMGLLDSIPTSISLSLTLSHTQTNNIQHKHSHAHEYTQIHTDGDKEHHGAARLHTHFDDRLLPEYLRQLRVCQ